MILYGIPNCDTVKKARAWLAEHRRPYTFHDFKKQGVPPEALARWVDALGWEALLNRKGTTWRQLDPAAQAAVVSAGSAQLLMQVSPSVIKRPVVDWRPGITDTPDITVGFDAAAWQARV